MIDWWLIDDISPQLLPSASADSSLHWTVIDMSSIHHAPTAEDYLHPTAALTFTYRHAETTLRPLLLLLSIICLPWTTCFRTSFFGASASISTLPLLVVFYHLSRLSDDHWWSFVWQSCTLLLNNLTFKQSRCKIVDKNLAINVVETAKHENIYLSVSLLMWYRRPNIENICLLISLSMWYRRPKIENICIYEIVRVLYGKTIDVILTAENQSYVRIKSVL